MGARTSWHEQKQYLLCSVDLSLAAGIAFVFLSLAFLSCGPFYPDAWPAFLEGYHKNSAVQEKLFAALARGE